MHNASVQSSFYRTTIEAGVQIGEIRAWSFDDELMTSNMESLGKRSVLDLHLTHLPQASQHSGRMNCNIACLAFLEGPASTDKRFILLPRMVGQTMSYT